MKSLTQEIPDVENTKISNNLINIYSEWEEMSR